MHGEIEKGLLPLVCATAGSVDDGKSTLIGRLLHDAKALMSDQLEHVAEVSKRRGLERTDLALLTDGLRAEREQGITIDVAWRYFATPRRRFTLADSPGHVQYTLNMVTAASYADVAIVLVDARRGVTEQTRRHLFIARLLGVPGITVAINKMDQVDFSFDVFAGIRDQVAEYLGVLDVPPPLPRITVLPVSALHGDNIVEASSAMPWFDGVPLLTHLETQPTATDGTVAARLAVQSVLRPQSASHPDFRGYTGRLHSGVLAVGQTVRVLPSGITTRISALFAGGEPIEEARAGRSVVVCLAEDVDVGRGDWIVDAASPPPRMTNDVVADVAWLTGTGIATGPASLLLKAGTREVRASIEAIEGRYDLGSGRRTAYDGTPLARNDLARIRVRTAAPIVADAYRDARASGSFLLIDPTTTQTLAAGMVC